MTTMPGSLLPDGRRYYITVFIRDSKESDETNASVIAAISKAVYDWVCITPAP